MAKPKVPKEPRAPRKNGKRSREKGAEGEREVAILLREFYAEAKRGLAQSRSAKEVADVTGAPWWVETKWKHVVNIHAAVAQALEAGEGKPILVVTKRTGDGDWLVTVPMKQWLEEHRELHKLRAELKALTEEMIEWRKDGG